MGKQIVVYGSACNPPHLMHHRILEDLKSTGYETWYLPVYSHMFGKDMIDPRHRMAMAEITADIVGATICDYEFGVQKQSPTNETLAALEKQNPDATFAFAIGADNIVNFPKWKRWEYLADRYTIFAYHREGDQIEGHELLGFFRDLRIRNVDLTDIGDASSTKVRAMVAEGDPEVSKYVHPDVLEYINQHNLYRGDE